MRDIKILALLGMMPFITNAVQLWPIDQQDHGSYCAVCQNGNDAASLWCPHCNNVYCMVCPTQALCPFCIWDIQACLSCNGSMENGYVCQCRYHVCVSCFQDMYGICPSCDRTAGFHQLTQQQGGAQQEHISSDDSSPITGEQGACSTEPQQQVAYITCPICCEDEVSADRQIRTPCCQTDLCQDCWSRSIQSEAFYVEHVSTHEEDQIRELQPYQRKGRCPFCQKSV